MKDAQRKRLMKYMEALKQTDRSIRRYGVIQGKNFYLAF